MTKKLFVLILAVALCLNAMMSTASATDEGSSSSDSTMFTDISIKDVATGEVWSDLNNFASESSTLEVDKDYIVSATISVAADDLSDDYKEEARGCDLTVFFSKEVKANMDIFINAQLTGDNLVSAQYTYARAKVSTSTAFEIVPNSLTISSNGAADGSILSGNDLNVDNFDGYAGVIVGYDAIDGTIPVGKTVVVSCQIHTSAAKNVDDEPVGSAGIDDPITDGFTPVSTMPPSPEPSQDPSMPKIYDGMAMFTPRTQYQEKTRPSHDAINSVTNNPSYGNEFEFLTITDLTGGKSYRSGTMEIIADHQYQITIYCRNDNTYTDNKSGFQKVHISIHMPNELGCGGVYNFAASINAKGNTPPTITSTVSMTARQGISLQYIDDSAYYSRNGGSGNTVAYNALFRNGVDVVNSGLSTTYLKGGEYITLAFSVQAVADDDIPPVQTNADIEALVTAVEVDLNNLENPEPEATGAPDSEPSAAVDNPNDAKAKTNPAGYIIPALVLVVILACLLGYNKRDKVKTWFEQFRQNCMAKVASLRKPAQSADEPDEQPEQSGDDDEADKPET